MTNPEEMRRFSARFQGHADEIEAESTRAFASSQNISGAGWNGLAQTASLGTMTELNQAFKRIHEQMMFVSQGLARSAAIYDQNEGDAAATLRS